MKEQHNKKDHADFSTKVARILPLITKEFAVSQHAYVFSKIPLTMSQIFILEFLAEQEICKMNGLAKTLNLSMSAVTSIIDKMITLKLVKRERSSADRRVVNVIMLNKGKEMLVKIGEANCRCVNELFSTLTQKDKDEYLRILRKLYDSLRKRR